MRSTFRLNFCRMVWWEVSCASLIRKETSRTTIHDKEYSQYDMWLKTPLMYNHTYFYAIEDVLSNRTHAGRTHHPILWNPSVSPLLVAKMSVGDPAECMPSVCCLQVQDVSSMFHKTGSHNCDWSHFLRRHWLVQCSHYHSLLACYSITIPMPSTYGILSSRDCRCRKIRQVWHDGWCGNVWDRGFGVWLVIADLAPRLHEDSNTIVSIVPIPGGCWITKFLWIWLPVA